MKKKSKFPDQIFVGKESDKDTYWLVADDSPDGLGVVNDDREIGIYKLIRVATIKNRTTVE